MDKIEKLAVVLHTYYWAGIYDADELKKSNNSRTDWENNEDNYIKAAREFFEGLECYIK